MNQAEEGGAEIEPPLQAKILSSEQLLSKKSCTTSKRCSGSSCSLVQQSIKPRTAVLSPEKGATIAIVDRLPCMYSFTRIP